MPRKSLEKSDYIKLARKNGLEFTAPKAPDYCRDSTSWRCTLCGRNMRKSYNNLKFGKNPCRCRNSQTLKSKDYLDLAHKLGIVWQDDSLVPINVYKSTTWYSDNTGKSFSASYHDLGYNQIPERFRKHIKNENA